MLAIPENKTRKRLRITLCVFYLIQIFLCTTTYVYIPSLSEAQEEKYKTVVDMLLYIGEDYSSISGGEAFSSYFLMYFVFFIIPIVGFLFCAFDKQRNIKNIVSLICSLLGVISILMIVTPALLNIGCYGSLLALLLYILTSFITMYSIMARIADNPKKEENN